MKKIDAYVTTDNTLFRTKSEAEFHEKKARMIETLDRVCWNGMIEYGKDMYDFIKNNREVVMGVLGVSYDYMARWVAEHK